MDARLASRVRAAVAGSIGTDIDTRCGIDAERSMVEIERRAA
jgi:hypothetical protein